MLADYLLSAWLAFLYQNVRMGGKDLAAQIQKKFELELICLYFKILRQITWKVSQTSEAKSSAKYFSAWQLVI